MILETVFLDTPAISAMSLMVALRSAPLMSSHAFATATGLKSLLGVSVTKIEILLEVACLRTDTLYESSLK
ncbi:MAG: hypothetical protein AAGL89_10775, partial [Pseudomonadota bacterium]